MTAAIDHLYVLRLRCRVRGPVDVVLFAIIIEPPGFLPPGAFYFLALAQPGGSNDNPFELSIIVITPVNDLIRRVLHEKAARSPERILLGSARNMNCCARKVHSDIAL